MRTFAVIGLGRFGKKLAVALTASGAEVIAIDRDRGVIEDIRDQVTHAVRLDSTDQEALKSQAIGRADIAIIGIGQGGQAFEAAVLTVVNLQQLGVKQIYARAQNLVAGQVLAAVGATEVIYPEIESAQRWASRLIAPHISDKIDFAPGYSLARIKAPASWNGKTIAQIDLRKKYNVNLIAVKRTDDNTEKNADEADIINVPMPQTVIYTGDTLMVAGSDEDIARLPQE